LDPAPLVEDLHEIYRNYFTHPEAKGGSSESRMRQILYRLYLGVTAVPAALAGLRSSKLMLESMYLQEQKPGSLLDVGCGDGAFLNRMRHRGWTVNGVDFDPGAIRGAKVKYGLDLRLGDLHSASFADNAFDAVTMSHVIEHVPDPQALFQEAHRILRPGGRLVLTTPNPSSYGHREFKAHWFGLDVPRHLYLFPLNVLTSLGRQAGFQGTEAWSSAARADTFLGASLSIRNATHHKSEYFPRPSVLRTLRAIRLQYSEHWGLRTDPACGEEAVLVCTK
jgi:2-polyprenyl-3-methyl-5-hydroxy-6-metoxy-1,4-benzoquinol methylase